MIDVTYFEAVGLLATTPLVVFYTYWKGYNNGKRQGYMSGRAVSRHPVHHDR
jgi:hypothetical protein